MRPTKPRDAFFKLFKAAEEVKIDISLHGVQVADNGYRFVQFIARTPSKATLLKLVDHIGAKIGLTAWAVTTEADFKAGEPLTVQTAKDVSDAAEGYGKANEKLRKKRERKDA